MRKCVPKLCADGLPLPDLWAIEPREQLFPAPLNSILEPTHRQRLINYFGAYPRGNCRSRHRVACLCTQYLLSDSGPSRLKTLTDARIAVVKAALQLTPEQEKLWPPVEEAIRARAETRYQRITAIAQRRSQQGEVDPIALLRDRSDALAAKAAALKKLADAWAPLHQSLNADQKQRMRLLAVRILHMREGVDPHPMAMYDETDDCD